MYFLDCEASSLNDDSYPIEIAWVDEAGHGESYLIQPEPSWTDWSASMHGISHTKLHQDGRPAAFVAQRTLTMLAKHTLVSDNPPWDEGWLTKLVAIIGHHGLVVTAMDQIMTEQSIGCSS